MLKMLRIEGSTCTLQSEHMHSMPSSSVLQSRGGECWHLSSAHAVFGIARRLAAFQKDPKDVRIVSGIVLSCVGHRYLFMLGLWGSLNISRVGSYTVYSRVGLL